ncbi:protein-export chaperone SecB [Anoxybacillus sp. FSL W8-1294]|jgi:preprotein translocase subunit SecB|uniref:protein-export chaperone SecB n=1 Tax=Anoxybacillus sp. FSL W8-1294 TaxID=2954655 RepID=UPI0030CD349A
MEKIYERLIQAVDLDNLYLHSINSKRYYPDPFQGNVDVDIQTGQRLEYYKDDFFAALAMFYINAHEENNPDNKVFDIEFSYILEYRLQKSNDNHLEGENLEEAIKLFVQRNVPINIWPYARELISQLTTRMGFPQLLIGTYKYIPQSSTSSE